MPYWQPNWQDVRWDSSTADAFIGTLLATAAALESIVQDHRNAGATSFLSWRGEKSTTLQAALETSYQHLLGLATSYRELAQRVRTQNDRALEEQARRNQERRRWHAEAAAEQQRTQLQRLQSTLILNDTDFWRPECRALVTLPYTVEKLPDL